MTLDENDLIELPVFADKGRFKQIQESFSCGL